MSSVNRNSDGLSQAPRREVTGRLVLIGLVGFFGLVAAVNAVMVAAAVSTFGGIETANAYRAGLAFASEEAAAAAQQSRHWRVMASLRPQPSGSLAIELSAHDSSGRPIAGLEASVGLQHPTNRRLDRTVAMRADGPGRFHGNADAAPGQWDLVIDLSQDGRRLFRSKKRVSLPQRI
jgi:nitrogen fixation protein FixH